MSGLEIGSLEKIDRELFMPLSEFMQVDRLDEHFKYFASKKVGFYRLDENGKKGEIFEIYVKYLISRFQMEHGDLLSEPEKKSGWIGAVDSYRVKYYVDGKGSTVFRENNKEQIGEMDYLLLYNNGGRKIPIIFESTTAMHGLNNTTSKRVLAGLMFNERPYLCKIRPTRQSLLQVRDTLDDLPQIKEEKAGLYRKEEYNYYRKILITLPQDLVTILFQLK